MSVPMRWQQEETVAIPLAPTPTLPRRGLVTRRARRVRLLAGLSLVALTLGGVTAVGARVGAAYLAPSPALRDLSRFGGGAQVTATAPHLERKMGYITLTGSAQNRTTHELRDVEAVVELLDGQGNTVRMDSALLALNRLPRHGLVPFQVEMQDDPAATAYRVRFRELLGASLN